MPASTITAVDGVEPRRGAAVLLEVLRSEGVRYIFGNPGTTELALMDALTGAPDISYIWGLQEASVVAMADGYAQASGKPGIRQPPHRRGPRPRHGGADQRPGLEHAARGDGGPAGHAPQPDGPAALRRPRQDRRAGRQMGPRGDPPRSIARAGAARLPRLHGGAERPRVPVAAHGRDGADEHGRHRRSLDHRPPGHRGIAARACRHPDPHHARQARHHRGRRDLGLRRQRRDRGAGRGLRGAGLRLLLAGPYPVPDRASRSGRATYPPRRARSARGSSPTTASSRSAANR